MSIPKRMGEHPWAGRYSTAVTALQRAGSRLKRITIAEAPADLNTPHLSFMLRPSMVRLLAHAIEDTAESLYAIETYARHRRYRPRAQLDLTAARRHLQQAANLLNDISVRGRAE